VRLVDVLALVAVLAPALLDGLIPAPATPIPKKRKPAGAKSPL
jgi:hypothetical protein